ncbi:MAG: histidine kinase [Eubacteriales bacterium]
MSCIFILVFVIFASACAGIYVFAFTDLSYEEYYSSSYSILSGINSRFEDYVQQINIYSNLILDESMDIGMENDVIIDNMVYVLEDGQNIESLYYFSESDDTILVVNDDIQDAFSTSSDMENATWYRTALVSDDYYSIQSQHVNIVMSNLFATDGDVEVFSFVKKMENENNEMEILCINIHEDYMKNICKDSLTKDSEILQCLNDSGEIIYATDSLPISDREYIYTYINESGEESGNFVYTSEKDATERTVVYVMSQEGTNIIFKCIENQELNKALSQALMYMLWIMLLVLIIVIVIVLYSVAYIMKPIDELKRCSELFAQGNTEVRIENHREDESKLIGESFNLMAENIDQLIKEKYKLEVYNKNAQLYSLMAQINPHFLNNVLQSIGCVALENDMKDIYKATTTLARMLRYSIKGGDVVRLEQELENIDQYLYIQKFRLEDRLEVNIVIPDYIETIQMPKLSLQPLIENAITHGFESIKTKCKLEIIVESTEIDLVHIVIRDNGVGIKELDLYEIKNNLINEKFEFEEQHIGLSNVYRRLKYMYDTRFIMDIKSVWGDGTEIDIKIRRK